MLWLTAESSSCMRSSEVVTFFTRSRTGISSELTRTNLIRKGICAGTVNGISGAPKI